MIRMVQFLARHGFAPGRFAHGRTQDSSIPTDRRETAFSGDLGLIRPLTGFGDNTRSECSLLAGQIEEISGLRVNLNDLTLKEMSSLEFKNENGAALSKAFGEHGPIHAGAFFQDQTNTLTIISDAPSQFVDEMWSKMKISRIPIQDKKQAQALLAKLFWTHELVHASHFAKDPELFARARADAARLATVSSTLAAMQQEAATLLKKFDEEEKQGITIEGVEIVDLPKDLQPFALRAKELESEFPKQLEEVQHLTDKCIACFAFREGIADFVTRELALREGLEGAYDLVCGRVPNYKKLGKIGKRLQEMNEAAISRAIQKSGGDPKIALFRLRGLDFMEALKEKFGGNAKAAVLFAVQNPPDAFSEIENPAIYFAKHNL